MATPEYPLRISPGTQVVVGSRRTGVVVEIVDGDPVAYRVRYPAGDEVVLGRDQLRIRKQAQQAALGPVRDPAALMGELLDDWVVYRCVTGSQAYGLAEDGSDVDIRGVFVAPAERLWSLQGAPDYFEQGEMEEAYWELAKFATLALKANPNVLECLTPRWSATSAPSAPSCWSCGRRSCPDSCTRPTTATSCPSSRSSNRTSVPAVPPNGST
jgi:hypothetical protein